MQSVFRKFHDLYFLIPIIAYGLLYWILNETSLNINHDVTLFLETGHRLLDGQTPYVDFYEFNFPIIQYLSAIPVLGSRLLNVNAIIVTQLMTHVLIGWSAVSLFFLTRRFTHDEHLPYILPTSIIVYSTALQIPPTEAPLFAQREHLFILLFLPFVLIRLDSWDAEHKSRSVWYRFLYGFIAATGVAVKPYFAIVPVLVELYGLSIHRDWKRLLRAEIIGFALFAGLHLIYFIIFPDIRAGLADMLALAEFGYTNYIRINHPIPFVNWLAYGEIRNTFFIIFIFWIIQYPSDKMRLVVRTLCMVTVAGVIIFSLQVGFNYHRIIYHSTLWMMILYGLARFMHPPHDNDNQNYTILRNPMSYIIVLTSLYIFGIYFNMTLSQQTQFKELTPYQEFILEVTETNEGILVIDYQFDGRNYPDLYQIDRRAISPYLIDAPYSLSWKIEWSVEERLNSYSPHAELWLERLTQFIQDEKPRIIVFNPEIHDYAEGAGFIAGAIQPQYDVIQSNEEFIAYQSRG
jgi:hypothetical protein